MKYMIKELNRNPVLLASFLCGATLGSLLTALLTAFI